jgi:hypothetical protein
LLNFTTKNRSLSAVTLKLQKGNIAGIKKFEKFSFLLGGAILLLSAYNRHESGVMNSVLFEAIYYSAYIIGGIANIAAGVLYEKIPEDKKASMGQWLQIIIAVLLLFDAIDKLMKGKIAMPAALIFASLLYFMVAIFTSKLKGRRFITIDENKISFRKSLFKIRTIGIDEVENISYQAEKIILSLNRNKKIIFSPADDNSETIKLFVDKFNELKKLNTNTPANTF